MPRDPDCLGRPRLSTLVYRAGSRFLHNGNLEASFVYSGPLKIGVLLPRRPDLASGRRLKSGRTRPARDNSALPAREGGGQRARRHKADRKRGVLESRPRGSRATPRAARPSGAGGARPPPLAPPPLPSPPLRPGLRRRGCSRAAKRPGRAGSRRKDARALGGGEVIKGKEPAAGGSGRFSCSRLCCLVFGPSEGRSLDSRRCRPQ